MHKHLTFKKAEIMIAHKEHIPVSNAGAILAHSARNASCEAIKRNPHLLRVHGVHKCRR